MAGAQINEVRRIGDTATQDQISVNVFFYGNSSGCKEVNVIALPLKGATVAQFKATVAAAIIAAGAAQSPAFVVTGPDIGGHN